jgi:hypothetical protein
MIESLGARRVPSWFGLTSSTLRVRDALAGTGFGSRAALAMFAPALGAAPSVCRRAGGFEDVERGNERTGQDTNVLHHGDGMRVGGTSGADEAGHETHVQR